MHLLVAILFVLVLARAIDGLSVPVEPPPELYYFVHYKPALTLCTLNDDVERSKRKNRPARPTLDPPISGLHPCGRLDRDSEGLLLLTNDGKFTSKVCGTGCQKIYWAMVQGESTISDESLSQMRRGGLDIRGKITRPPVSVEPIDPPSTLAPPATGMQRRSPNCYWLEIILTEGRNRQVRRITADAGYQTVRLVRVAVGNLLLSQLGLSPGEYKTIQPADVLG